MIAAAILMTLGFTVAATQHALAAYNSNTAEDNFLRANQNGFGGSTNNDLVTQNSWHDDADGTHTYDTISNHKAVFTDKGANTENFAGDGITSNGGDAVAEFSFPSVDQTNFKLLFNACAGGSCTGYQAIVSSNAGALILNKNGTNETSANITLTSGVKYWVRFNYDGSGNLKAKFWAASTPEPSSWTVSWTDTGTLLGSNYSAMGTYDLGNNSDTVNVYEWSLSTTSTTAAVPPTLNQQFGTQNAGTDSYSNGTYIVQQNEFNSTAAESTTTDNRPDLLVQSSSINNSTSGAPGAYTSTFFGCHYSTCTSNDPFPVAVSSVETSGTVKTSVTTDQNSAGGAWDNAYDIWFNNTSGDNQSNGTNLEMMIWLGHNGSVQPAGSKVASSVSIGGNTYDVWYSGSGTGGTLSYVLTTSVTSLSNLDLSSLASDAVTRGYMTTSWYLYDVEHGFEIWQNGAGLSQDSYQVCVSGTCY